ncbi:hypothetical protein COO60DRAFT_141136 [Scenedesmus sp. NREL 46B-D3]|nr:hypothetical protein COO60DRAFT_141136 [Scenedesmus sp. NREL 46B-D3]
MLAAVLKLVTMYRWQFTYCQNISGLDKCACQRLRDTLLYKQILIRVADRHAMRCARRPADHTHLCPDSRLSQAVRPRLPFRSLNARGNYASALMKQQAWHGSLSCLCPLDFRTPFTTRPAGARSHSVLAHIANKMLTAVAPRIISAHAARRTPVPCRAPVALGHTTNVQLSRQGLRARSVALVCHAAAEEATVTEQAAGKCRVVFC